MFSFSKEATSVSIVNAPPILQERVSETKHLQFLSLPGPDA